MIQKRILNEDTGILYRFIDPPGKWVPVATHMGITEDLFEGDAPKIGREDYKLWYSTDTLELYFWFEDVNGTGAWVPTSAPITMLEDLDAGYLKSSLVWH